jgi:hypothetical protein
MRRVRITKNKIYSKERNHERGDKGTENIEKHKVYAGKHRKMVHSSNRGFWGLGKSKPQLLANNRVADLATP